MVRRYVEAEVLFTEDGRLIPRSFQLDGRNIQISQVERVRLIKPQEESIPSPAPSPAVVLPWMNPAGYLKKEKKPGRERLNGLGEDELQPGQRQKDTPPEEAMYDEFTVRIRGRERHLYFQRCNEATGEMGGRWFILQEESDE